MSLGLDPIDPQEDSYRSVLARLLELDQEPEVPEPQFQGGQSPGILERFGQSFGGLPQPTGFAQGLVSGLGGGLARRGQRLTEERSKFEAAKAERQGRRDQAHLTATAEYRRRLLDELNDSRKSERKGKAEQAQYDLENPIMNAELRARVPGLARIPDGTRVPSGVYQEALKRSLPQEPGKAERPKLVEVTNPDGSTTLVVERPGLQTKPKGGGAAVKPPTEAQQRSESFTTSARRAASLAEAGGLENRILRKAYGTRAPRQLQDEDQQAYNQAAEEFTLVLNRLESGAAISPSEFSRVRELYFVSPGDKPATLERKRKARAARIEELLLLQSPGQQAASATPEVPATWKRVE